MALDESASGAIGLDALLGASRRGDHPLAAYTLLVLAPLAGWLHSSAAGLSVNWFGLFQVPDLVPKNPELSDLFKQTHRICVALLALMILGHVGAALRHEFVLRDGVLHRMLPWKPSRTIE